MSNWIFNGIILSATWQGVAIADAYIASATTWNSKQVAYTSLSTLGLLANASGWLQNNGSGTFTWSTPTKSDVGLGSVENTALSTWAGSTNLITLGTITTGIWHGTAIAHAYLAPTFGTTAGTFCQGNDSRLSDSRAPTGSAGGDLAGSSYPNPTLAAIITAGGPTGDATHVAQITYDAKGRLTAVSSVSIQIAESQVTSLTSDLALKAPLASPTFTGTPAAPTAAADTNSTQIATTAFVLGQLGTSTPIVNGTGAAGSGKRMSREDHVHPTDTSRLLGGSATLTITGDQTAMTCGTLDVEITGSADYWKIQGITAGVNGQLLHLTNVGTKDILICHESASATAANRINMPRPLYVDFILRPGDTYILKYDGTKARWLLVSGYELFLRDQRYVTCIPDDFCGGAANGANNNNGEMGWVPSGTGTTTRVNSAGRAGVISLNCTAAATDRAHVLSNGVHYLPGTDDQVVYVALVSIPTLSTASNEFFFAIGIGNVVGGMNMTLITASASGIQFAGIQYRRGGSTKWAGICTNMNGLNGTEQATNDTVTAGQWDELIGIMDYGNTVFTPYVNGNAGTAITTNLPDATNGMFVGNIYFYCSAHASGTQNALIDGATVWIIRRKRKTA